MRRLLPLLFAATLTVALPAGAALAQASEPARRELDGTAIAAGLGALAGVIAFNAALLGVGALPGGAAYLGVTTIPAAWSVAVSRVYAVGSGVVGAWTADYLFGPVGAGDSQARLSVLGTGAVAGIAAFNLATGPMGVLPMVGATLEPVPMSTVLGSRLIAVTTAGLGAIGGTWIYDRMSGRDTDLTYAFSLLGGAIGGVALTNYLTAGQFGTLPLSVASGMAGAGETIAGATTAAASRVWVVGSGVAGAMAANWPFQWRSAAQAPSVGMPPAATAPMGR